MAEHEHTGGPPADYPDWKCPYREGHEKWMQGMSDFQKKLMTTGEFRWLFGLGVVVFITVIGTIIKFQTSTANRTNAMIEIAKDMGKEHKYIVKSFDIAQTRLESHKEMNQVELDAITMLLDQHNKSMTRLDNDMREQRRMLRDLAVATEHIRDEQVKVKRILKENNGYKK